MKGKRPAEQNEARLAAPIYLSRALDGLGMPVRLAERWIKPTHLVEFLEEVENHARVLKSFIDGYIEKHSIALNGEDVFEIEEPVRFDIARMQKNLELLAELRSAGKADFAAEAEELRKLRSGELKP